MRKIVIIEDDNEHFNFLTNWLDADDIEIVPANEEVFDELRSSISANYKAGLNREKRLKAKAFINEFIANNQADLYIIDYELNEGEDTCNGIRFCEDFIEQKKILFCTHMTDGKLLNEIYDFINRKEKGNVASVIQKQEFNEAFRQRLVEKVNELLTQKIENQTNVPQMVIGVVTALPVEFAAMRLMINDEYTPENIPPEDLNDYAAGFIQTNNGKLIKVVIAMMKEMGTNNASSVTTNMIRSFGEIDLVLLVGIAGGVPAPDSPKDHVRLGDIVCSNQILQYDNISDNGQEIKIRSNSDKPSPIMMGKYNILESDVYLNKFPWEEYIALRSEEYPKFLRPDASTDVLKVEGSIISHPADDLRRSGYPRIFKGCIGSSNTLLRNENKRIELQKKYGVRAIEMEGSGVADGTWSCDKAFFVVRGIVDYCNPNKSDHWHNYAALGAASFARSLIQLL